MNEKLEETVNTILQNAISAASQGTEFLKDQIPDLVRQLIAWKEVQYCVKAVFCSIAIFFFYKLGKFLFAKKMAYKGPEYDNDWTFPAYMATVLGGIAGAFCAIDIMFDVFNFLEILIAPKIWLLEYAASLVRK